MRRLTTGRALLTITATWSAFGSYVFDWNDTHIHNPEWTPHAKFHNAQTMSMGVYLAAPALWALWGPGRWDERAVLTTMLAYVRDTVHVKCAGLSDELARRAPLPG